MTEAPRLIGLTGLAGSGKDTVADILLSVYEGYRVAFADPLRVMADVLGVSVDRAGKELPIAHFGNKSPRYILQTLGTDWGRNMICKDIWLNIATAKIDRFMAGGSPVVVTDVRFDNEAQAIRNRGGMVWHVVRPGIARVQEHASESGVRQEACDVVLMNDGALSDLYDRVLALLT